MDLPIDTPGPGILIVDDQVANVKLLEHTLRRAGYANVMSTTDPCQVTTLHLQQQYDLILLDLQMPAMNGLEVIAQLREVRAAHPVTILVLSADGTQTKAALAKGADSFLAKPFRLPEVVERVELLLKARS